MPAFRFNLQAVLDQRERTERDRRLVVAALERERIELESSIASSQRAISATKEDLREALGGSAGGPINPRSVRLQAGASLHLQARTQRLALRLAGVYQRLEAARIELREASASRKAVELLRERRRDEWRTRLRRAENAELDEIVTMRHSRNTQEA